MISGCCVYDYYLSNILSFLLDEDPLLGVLLVLCHQTLQFSLQLLRLTHDLILLGGYGGGMETVMDAGEAADRNPARHCTNWRTELMGPAEE